MINFLHDLYEQGGIEKLKIDFDKIKEKNKITIHFLGLKLVFRMFTRIKKSYHK